MVRGWEKKEVTLPRGAWTAKALIAKGNPARASIAQNVRFFPDQVYSREGTSSIVSGAAASKITGMYDWISPTDHLLLYMDGTTIKQYRFADGLTYNLLTGVGGRAPSFAELGVHTYFTAYDTSGNGTIQAHVYDGNYTNVDVCFRGPLSVTSLNCSDGGVGYCTQGQHNIGFVFQSRSGFSGKPSPVVAGAFTPSSVTLNAGLRTINAVLTLNTPSDAGPNSSVYPIMTRADNPAEYYFVPPGFYSPSPTILPANFAGFSITITISISDEDLANNGTPATDNFNLLVAGTSSGPFNPSWVTAYGRRMVYGAGVNVYASQINDPAKYYWRP
jgi:hypothetical protein